MISPENELKRAWETPGGRELWGTNGATYTSIAYERLPPPPQLASCFAWLDAVPDRECACTLDSSENKLGSLSDVESELGRLGYRLPDDFALFVRSPAIC